MPADDKALAPGHNDIAGGGDGIRGGDQRRGDEPGRERRGQQRE